MATDTVYMTRGRRVVPWSAVMRFMGQNDERSSMDPRGPLTEGSSSGVPPGGRPDEEGSVGCVKELEELRADIGGHREFSWFLDKLGVWPTGSIRRVVSAYAPAVPVPVLEDGVDGKRILVSVEDKLMDSGGIGPQRRLERIISSHSFLGSTHPVQSNVLIEAIEPDDILSYLHERIRPKYLGNSTVRPVWVAKLLALLRVRHGYRRSIGRPPQETTEKEVALIQYYDVVAEGIDPVDETLGCVKLRWAVDLEPRDGPLENDGNLNVDTAAGRRFFDVVDIATIRGSVHVLRGDYGLGRTTTYACDGDRNWRDQWFYINRFKTTPSGSIYTRNA